MGDSVSSPQILRVYKDDKKGATAFFRNRPFLFKMIALLKELNHLPRVLFHACSIGAEPYSFAAAARQSGLEISIDATDIVPEFIKKAQEATYPNAILAGMTDHEKTCFHDAGNREIKLNDDITSMVRFLPASSLLDFRPEKHYDAVFAMNVLTYLSPDAQRVAIKRMATYTDQYLCLTAFHPDQIKSDIETVKFEPVTEGQEDIHSAWGDRIRPGGAKPGTPEYAWVVPPYNSSVPDYEWRFSAIFRRVRA